MFSWSIYEKQALGRSRRIDLAGTQVKFAALEDVIIHKIIAGRPRDLEDVRLLLIKNPTFDQAYIEGWLKEFDEALEKDFGLRFQQVWQESKKER
jgi:predicted nucleotidyltransferase